MDKNNTKAICKRCGNELKVEAVSEGYTIFFVWVEPCETCLSNQALLERTIQIVSSNRIPT